MINSVAIFGDSWARHAFEKLPNPNDPVPFDLFIPGVNEPGNEQPLPDVSFRTLFLQHNIKVQNFSVSGSSNNNTLKTIVKYKEILKSCDAVLICQTDPFRDFCVPKSYLIDETKAQMIGLCSDINELAEQMCKEFYQSLSDLQKKINLPFVLFTGCSKLCEKYILKNLDYILPSWTHIVDPTCRGDCIIDTSDRALAVTDYLVGKFPQNAYKLKNSFFTADQAIKQRAYVWQTNKNFAWCHAAEGAYHKMFDKIMKKIGEINDRSQAHSG